MRYLLLAAVLLVAAPAWATTISYPATGSGGFAVSDDITTSASLTTDAVTPTSLGHTGFSLAEYLQGVDDAFVTGASSIWNHDTGKAGGGDDACLVAPIVSGEDASGAGNGRAIVFCTAYDELGDGDTLTDGYFSATRSFCSTDTQCRYEDVVFHYSDRLGGSTDGSDEDECGEFNTFLTEASTILDAMQGDGVAHPQGMTIATGDYTIHADPSNPCILDWDGPNVTNAERWSTWRANNTRIELGTGTTPDSAANILDETEDGSLEFTIVQNSPAIEAVGAGDFCDTTGGAWSNGDILCMSGDVQSCDAETDPIYVVTWVEPIANGCDLAYLDRPVEEVSATISAWNLYQSKMLEIDVDWLRIEGRLRILWSGGRDDAWEGVPADLTIDSQDCGLGECTRNGPRGYVRLKGSQMFTENIRIEGGNTHPFDYTVGVFSDDGNANRGSNNGNYVPREFSGFIPTEGTGTADTAAYYETMLAGTSAAILCGTNECRVHNTQAVTGVNGVFFYSATGTAWHNIDMGVAGDDMPQWIRAFSHGWLTARGPSQEQDQSFNGPWIEILPGYTDDTTSTVATREGFFHINVDKVSFSNDDTLATDRDFLHATTVAGNVVGIHVEGMVDEADSLFTLSNDAGIQLTGTVHHNDPDNEDDVWSGGTRPSNPSMDIALIAAAGDSESSQHVIQGGELVAGTVTSGTWNGTAIGAQYGGSGDDTSATTGVPIVTAGDWTYPTTLPHEQGGLEADVSAFSGVLAISGGATSEVDAKSELEAQIADVSDFAEADGDTYTGVHDFGGATVEIPNTTVAGLPAATLGRVAIVTDGADADDCTTGGGSAVVDCMANGTSWEPTGDSGAGSGAFSDSADPVVLNTTTKDVQIGDAGATGDAGKLEIGGDADQVQLVIQGHSTQTSNLVTIEQDGGTDVFTLTNAGAADFAGAVTATSFTADPSATPQTSYTDSDTTDQDISAHVGINCTTLSTGAEDCDYTIGTQTAGSDANATPRVFIDGDGPTHIEGSYAYIGDSTTPATPNTALAENDLFVEDALEVDGATDLDGTLNVAGAVTLQTDLAVADGGTGASTAAGARVNLGVNEKCDLEITMEDPTDIEDATIGYTKEAITITSIETVIIGATSVDIQIRHSTDRSAVGNALWSADQTVDSTTTGEDLDGSPVAFADATIPADSWVWLETSAAVGTPNELFIAACYTID